MSDFSHHTENDEAAKATGLPVQEHNPEGRRNIIKTGLALVPVILTLTSRPALGCTCVAPSRSLSKNTSHQNSSKWSGTCSWSKPRSYWQNCGDKELDHDFHEFCGTGKFYYKGSHCYYTKYKKTWHSWGGGYTYSTVSKSFKDVFEDTHDDMGSWFACAYFNIKHGYVPPNVLSTSDLLGMFQEYSQTGVYHPTATVTWGKDQIKAYLKNNNICPG